MSDYLCESSRMSAIRLYVLGALAERGEMHGHGLRLLAEQEHIDEWTDFTVGAIYGVLKRMAADGVIERVAYPMLDGAAPLPAAAMLDRVSQVTLRYRLAGAWSDTWQGQPRTPLPDAVEMVITRADGTVFRELFLVGSGYGAPDEDTGAADGG